MAYEVRLCWVTDRESLYEIQSALMAAQNRAAPPSASSLPLLRVWFPQPNRAAAGALLIVILSHVADKSGLKAD